MVNTEWLVPNISKLFSPTSHSVLLGVQQMMNFTFCKWLVQNHQPLTGLSALLCLHVNTQSRLPLRPCRDASEIYLSCHSKIGLQDSWEAAAACARAAFEQRLAHVNSYHRNLVRQESQGCSCRGRDGRSVVKSRRVDICKRKGWKAWLQQSKRRTSPGNPAIHRDIMQGASPGGFSYI